MKGPEPPMDVKQYLQQVTPYSVTQLLPTEALRSFLDGYSFALRLGITVLYPKGLPSAGTLSVTPMPGAARSTQPITPCAPRGELIAGCAQGGALPGC